MKNSQNGFALLTILLIAAGVLVVGGAGYWYYQNQTQTPQLIGGQTDEHGCLGPAGYSWCEVKQKCLRVWEEPCEATSTAQDLNQSEQEKQLSLARLKAKDALIKSDLLQVEQQAKSNYAEVGKGYAGFCTDTFIIKTLTNIRTATGIAPTTCNSSVIAFAASSPLATDSTKFWCVDSTGFNDQTTTSLGTSAVCPK